MIFKHRKSGIPDATTFEKMKWADEVRLKERELELKQREVDKSVCSTPLFLAICAAIVTAAASIYVASDNSRRQHELELTKAEQARILEAIRTGNPDKAAVNLQFMLDVGLIQTPDVAGRLAAALSKRIPGQGPYLSTWVEQDPSKYRYSGGYSNPSTSYVEYGCVPGVGRCTKDRADAPSNVDAHSSPK